MSYRIGIVKQTGPGGYAQVETERKSACGECEHTKMVCYGCMLSPKMVARVANPIGAAPGDEVKIHLASGRLLLAAGMFYLVPIFTLLIGIISGVYISDASGISETTASVGGAFAGLAVGMAFVTMLGRINVINKLVEPEITSIVRPAAA